MERKIKDFLPTECINTLRAGVAIAAMTGNVLEMLDVFLDSETTAELEGVCANFEDEGRKLGICGNCGAILVATNIDKYCRICGTKIKWEVE